jgi:hypothetical protein
MPRIAVDPGALTATDAVQTTIAAQLTELRGRLDVVGAQAAGAAGAPSAAGAAEAMRAGAGGR